MDDSASDFFESSGGDSSEKQDQSKSPENADRPFKESSSGNDLNSEETEMEVDDQSDLDDHSDLDKPKLKPDLKKPDWLLVGAPKKSNRNDQQVKLHSTEPDKTDPDHKKRTSDLKKPDSRLEEAPKKSDRMDMKPKSRSAKHAETDPDQKKPKSLSTKQDSHLDQTDPDHRKQESDRQNTVNPDDNDPEQSKKGSGLHETGKGHPGDRRLR